jgi:hypothetical protein
VHPGSANVTMSRIGLRARLSKIILSWTTGIDFMRAVGTQKAVFE